MNRKKLNITIIGLGLIGGSLGLLIKKNTNHTVSGFSRRKITILKAVEKKAIDTACFSLKQSVKNADLVIIATPIAQFSSIFKSIRKWIQKDAIVTDVASVKAPIVKEAQKHLPKFTQFIGGHPMAGKVTLGIDNAESEMFHGATWILTPTKKTCKKTILFMKQFLKNLGFKTIIVKPSIHDKAVAIISHLPAAISVSLCNTASENIEWNIAKKLVSSGFQDTSRLAAAPEELTASFFLFNKKNMLAVLKKNIKQLQNLESIIQKGERKKIFNVLKKARNIRKELLIL